jgi:hypothetical protein
VAHKASMSNGIWVEIFSFGPSKLKAADPVIIRGAMGPRFLSPHIEAWRASVNAIRAEGRPGDISENEATAISQIHGFWFKAMIHAALDGSLPLPDTFWLNPDMCIPLRALRSLAAAQNVEDFLRLHALRIKCARCEGTWAGIRGYEE